MLKENQYQCAICKGIFDEPDQKDWSENDKREEYLKRYDFEFNAVPYSTICDDCDKEFIEWFNNFSLEEKEKLKNEALADALKQNHIPD